MWAASSTKGDTPLTLEELDILSTLFQCHYVDRAFYGGVNEHLVLGLVLEATATCKTSGNKAESPDGRKPQFVSSRRHYSCGDPLAQGKPLQDVVCEIQVRDDGHNPMLQTNPITRPFTQPGWPTICGSTFSIEARYISFLHYYKKLVVVNRHA